MNLGDALHFAGQVDESEEAFRTARDLSKNTLGVDASDSEALITLAWAQYMLGESTEALASIEKGLEIDPSDPYGYYYDALIRFQTGDDEAALDSLEIALDKGYPAGLLVSEHYLGDLRGNARFHAMIIESFQ